MRIGIDASRAFQENRTGIEEYSFQVIKGLMNKLEKHQVVLYTRRNQEINLNLPNNWQVKVIKWPFLWTQIGLSLELLFHPVDVLFVPAHTVPIIHPKNTVVTIHGLEYEFCPKAYSFWARLYMHCVIKNSCQWAKKIIAVSKNTKKDLIELYKVPEEKINVVYEGVPVCHSERLVKNPSISSTDSSLNRSGSFVAAAQDDGRPYLLFIGRLEERKNICGIVEAFEILKKKYDVPHSLVLAGKHGFNYKIIKLKIENCKLKIIELGFVSEEEKYELLKNADVFLFPSFYEGFGLPILEAQAVGTPVVTSNISSMPEISCHSERRVKNPSISNTSSSLNRSGSFVAATQDDRCSAMLVDPNSSEEISEAVYNLISDENLRNYIINKGLENVKRFSWEKCAEEISKLLIY